LKSGKRQAGPLHGGPACPCRCQFQSAKSLPFWQAHGHEKSQLIKRLPAPLIRHLLASHRAGQLCAQAAATELGLAHTRLYELYADYLRASAQGHSQTWSPGLSGGDHHPDWTAEVTALLTTLLSSKPPCSYSAAASELHRRLNFKTDRASVRRWAIAHHLNPDTRYKPTRKPIKRWQARDYGALWQYDASPHAWLPETSDKQVLLDILDDATRLNTGARLYPSETLLAHFDFLSRVFQTHGLPLALYVDYHSFFYTHNPDAFTQLGQALHFYGVKLLYAPTPQAKGKIERRHDYWQKRLVPLLAADRIAELVGANLLLDPLVPHANQHEIHRELGCTPLQAQQQALAENRSVIRPAPNCPWWPYVWSQQTRVRVGDDGQVPVGAQRQPIDAPPRSRVIRCLRPDGDIYYLRHAPAPKAKPSVLLHCPVF
jgi:GAF domain-containing protein